MKGSKAPYRWESHGISFLLHDRVRILIDKSGGRMFRRSRCVRITECYKTVHRMKEQGCEPCPYQTASSKGPTGRRGQNDRRQSVCPLAFWSCSSPEEERGLRMTGHVSKRACLGPYWRCLASHTKLWMWAVCLHLLLLPDFAIHFSYALHVKPALQSSFQTNKTMHLAWVQTKGYRLFILSSLGLHVCKQIGFIPGLLYSCKRDPNLQNCPSEREVMLFSTKHH